MANFSSMRLTSAGLRLRAAAEVGQRLEITRIGLGAGRAPDDISALNALVDERQSAPVASFDAQPDGTGRVRFHLNNVGLNTGYPLREIGVFALDPDTGEEQLIDYTNAGDDYDLIPAEGGATVVEQMIDLITVISPTDNIVAQVDSTASVTRADLEALRVLPDGGEPGQTPMLDDTGHVIWSNGADLISLAALATSDIENKTAILRQEQYLIHLDQQLQQLANP
ncbi:hypothetical protein [Oceanospirillum sediminis]|uniref:Uncharacterized protein n=1 Tax=Oceanospirillum sediminis TaxID=2760088 RepID=A0A839IWP3_9GAMM|nr:hypothetical protein [Oceanospirillum sediminis]MBB1489381.1 hypothetical protein [Oceanospirillum sediminis]